MQTHELMYGKDTTERLVSVGIKKSEAILYIEESDGTITQKVRPFQRWLLCNKPFQEGNIELKGNLHYKYAKRFASLGEMIEYKQTHKQDDIFEVYNEKERLMVKEGITYFKGMKHTEVSILAFDIETTSIEHTKDAKVLLISNTFRKNGQITRKLFDFKEYDDEGEMIWDWCKWIREMNPTVICGHNINMFDLPYIKFIADKFSTPMLVGRDDSEIHFNNYQSKFRKDGSQFYHYNQVSIFGREIVDTLFLSIKYDVGRKYENYRLKNIIKQEGLEIKERQFYDADKIRFNYNDPEEWRKIKTYAIHDADDALALYDLMIPAIFYSAQIIPRPFQLLTETAEGGKINGIMLRAYLQTKHSVPKASPPIKYEGAISIGNPGIYRNVFKVDVASLYPSIMIQYQVHDKAKDPNGYFLEMVKTLTQERLKNKQLAKETGDKYYTNLEQSQKILINSAYGFLGATGLNFNSPANAAFVTKTGRDILTQSMQWSDSKGFKLVNADTDSISFARGDESFLSKEERQGFITELNKQFPEKIRFEDDGFYSCIVVIKAKNYIMRTEDGKVKYKGSAIKATGKEKALQEFIKEVVQEMLNGSARYLEVYNKYVKEIMNVYDINRWASKKTITDKVLESERTNEAKVREAIENSEYAEGDKIYVYFKEDDTLGLAENFDGKYNKTRLLEKLYKTACGFSTVVPKETFTNYKLKKSQKLLKAFK